MWWQTAHFEAYANEIRKLENLTSITFSVKDETVYDSATDSFLQSARDILMTRKLEHADWVANGSANFQIVILSREGGVREVIDI